MFLWYFGKNVPAFCLYPKNFLKAKFKSTLLFFFGRGDFKTIWHWFYHIITNNSSFRGLQQKKERVGQKKYKIYSLENNRTLKFLMLQSIFVLDERLKLLRIVPLRRGQIYIGIKGHVPSGQEYTQLTLQLVREGRRHFLILEGNCHQKLFLIWFTWYMFQPKLGAKYDSFVFIVLLLES